MRRVTAGISDNLQGYVPGRRGVRALAF